MMALRIEVVLAAVAATGILCDGLQGQTYRVDTYAGSPRSVGDGRAPERMRLLYPTTAVRDSRGVFYIADSDHHRVRMWAPDGTLSTVAGIGIVGYCGDGGPAVSACLNTPYYVAIDRSGDLYIAEKYGHRVRRVSAATGVINTVAGTGEPGFTGDGGLAERARLNNPTGLAFDAGGNLYVADMFNHRIRRIGRDGIIRTIAGTGEAGFGGDGGPATAARLYYPTEVVIDRDGNLVIADYLNARIRRVDSAGIIHTVAGNGKEGFSGDGGPAVNASLYLPWSVTAGPDGSIYIGDGGNNRVRKVDPTGVISTIAGTGELGFSGDGGPATLARLSFPMSAVPDGAGNLYVVDSSNDRIRRIDSSGNITTVLGGSYAGDGGAATDAEIGPPGMTLPTPAGDVLVASENLHRVRRVSPAGIISTVAGNGQYAYTVRDGRALDSAMNVLGPLALESSGNLYIASLIQILRLTPAGDLTVFAGGGDTWNIPEGVSAKAVKLEARGMAVDSSGVLYVALGEGDHRIVRIGADGAVRTFAGRTAPGYAGDGQAAAQAHFHWISQIMFDASGNLYVADRENHRIRKIDTRGIVSTVAGTGEPGFSGDGGPAVSARLNGPEGVWADASGNIYIADTRNQRIRKVDSRGVITTIAGRGTAGFSGDGGLAVHAEFNEPKWISVDREGRVFVSDTVNERVRVLTPIAANACVYALTPAQVNVPAGATAATVNVSASSANCLVEPATDAAWLRAAASGQGAINLTIAANTSKEWRTGTVRVGDARISVVQRGLPIPSVALGATVHAATNRQPVAQGSFATIYVPGLAERGVTWDTAIPDGRTLPKELAGVRVRVGGKDCFVSYVGPGQVNVLLPPDVAPGFAIVEVANAQGADRSWVEVAETAPGLFFEPAGGKLHAAALFAGRAERISTSRPAKPGDFVELYATGLGATADSYPVGQVLSRPYPVADLSRFAVRLGDRPAEVVYAGLVAAGLWQVNIRVPDGLPVGEVPVRLSMGGQTSPEDILLPVSR